MKLREKLKRFWTLDVHNHEGFTLVELIIVIAILAILSGVAVAGYSSYVKKANAQADKTMVEEIKSALMLAYYSGDLDESGYVVLSKDGATAHGDDVSAALTAAFGNLSSLKLKDTGYAGASTADYGNSSYKGKEDALLAEVNRLSNALSNTNIDLGTGEFSAMLGEYGYDKTSGAAVGNVATLYVAQKTKGQETLIINTFKANFKPGQMDTTAKAQTALVGTWTTLRGQLGDAAAMAAVYAYAEGYAQYYDSLRIEGVTKSAVNEFHQKAVFDGVSSADVAFGQLMLAFNHLRENFGNDNGDTANPKPLNAYMAEDGRGLVNLKAYVSMMGTVVDNKDVVEGNLASEDCFTDSTVSNLLNSYAVLSEMGISTQDGEVAVAIVVENGEATVHVLPLNMD